MTFMAKARIGLSMLFCLGESFSSLCQRLENTANSNVELVDDGWHSLDQVRVRRLNEIRKSRDLKFTLHAPFANINIATLSSEMRRFTVDQLRKSISFARELECAIIVFHPGLQTGISGFYPGLGWKLNIESVKDLLKLTEDFGIKIAMENCPMKYGYLVSSVDEFSRFLDQLGEDLGLALDVGHSNIDGETHALIKRLGRNIVHIHAHDNDGKRDLHLGVGCGTVNWKRFAKSIKQLDFDGVIVVESYRHIMESISKLQELFI